MKFFTFLLLFFSLTFQAQVTVKGIVKNAASGEALPFANITTDGTQTVTDVDGKFSLEVESSFKEIRVSYIGFDTRKIALDGSWFYTISLAPQTEKLKELIIGEKINPANAIIRNVIRRKLSNNPQGKLSSFEFKAYNKLVVTASPDSIDDDIDSVFITNNNQRQFSKLDSSDYKFKKMVSKRHLFQTEKVSQFQFGDNRLKETIIGTKMAGFSQPVYEVVAFKLQSFSIYNDTYDLLETKYISPISEVSFSKYTYKLLDTISVQNRPVYLVYFKPKRKKIRNVGLQGLLYIDRENFAIAKTIIRTKGVLDISATDEYTYLSEQKVWFPKEKEFRIVKGNNDEDIKILGETFQFDGDVTDSIPKRKKQASDFTYLLSKSYYFDAKYNVPITIRKPSIAIEIKDTAIHRSDAFWDDYRKGEADFRSSPTYAALDSLSKKEKIEGKLRFGRKILNGYLPLGPVDLDLRYLLSYNNYEGFRFGLGGLTSEKFSRKYRLDGYSAYGTKDGNFKYSFGGAARIGKFSNTWIGGSYTDDVREIASTSFATDKRVFKIYDPRPINISTFYNYQNYRAYIETKIIPKTESIWQLVRSRVDPKFNYAFANEGTVYDLYYLTTAQVSIQWNPFSEYMQTPAGRIEIEKNFPKFTFQFTQSLPEILDNDFDFTKIDFRAEYEKKYLNGQKSAILFQAGFATGDVPLTHLYNMSPNNLTKDRLMQRITIAGKNSFETMYFNEFFSSEYAMFQLKHGFKRLELFRKVRPALVLVSRIAWGNMQKPQRHLGIEYKTLEDGYFESGIELNQIYKGLGLTGFYRYGANGLPRFEDNIAVKISFVFDFGL